MRHISEKRGQQPGRALPEGVGPGSSCWAVVLMVLLLSTLTAGQAAVPTCPDADLALAIQAPSEAQVDLPVTIELRALNLGPNIVPAASLGIGVPPGVGVLDVTPAGSCSAGTASVSCTFSSLSVDQTFLASLSVVFTAPGTFTFGASISGCGFDPNPANNSASTAISATTTPPPAMARLSVIKEDGPDPVILGEDVAYGIAVTNTGDATARMVMLTDTLPLGVRAASFNPDDRCGVTEEDVDGDGRADRQIVTCNLGDLAPGATALVEIIVSTGGDTGETLINEVEVTSPDAAPALDATTTSVVSSVAHFAAAGDLGDPISTLTGGLFALVAEDIDLGGLQSVKFKRYYDSGLKRDGRIAGRLGNNWLHTYEAILRRDGDGIEVVTNQGRVVQFEKSGDVWLQIGKIDMPFQLVESDGDFILGDPRMDLLWTFDSAGRLLSIEDDAGNAQMLTYAGDILTQVSDGLGRTLTFSYNGTGHLSAVSDGFRTIRFDYNGNNLTSVTDPLGNVTTYDYDPADPEAGLLIATTRPRGNTLYTQTYDATDRVISQTDAEGNTFTLSYDPGETTITDPLGQTRRHVHSDQGELILFTDELEQTVVLGYDDTGRRQSTTDRLGDTTAYTYHAPSGKLASITHADGSTTTFEYTGRTIKGITLFNLTTITLPDDSSRRLEYDTAGNLARITDEAGNVWSYTNNEAGQFLTATNPVAGIIRFTYNDDATLATMTDPAGSTTTLEYDHLKRLHRLIHADGTSRTYIYDDRDLLLNVTDERGHTMTFTYDANGNLASAADALGNTTTFTYDALDRLISRTDPLGHTALVSYDERGRARQLTDRNGNTLTIIYDARGNPMAVTDASGQVWSRLYDAEGIIASTTDPLLHTRLFASGALGEITQITSPQGEVSRFTYNLLGRLTDLRDPLDNVVTLHYDGRGLLVGMTLPEGIAAVYARDALGRTTHVIDPNGNVWERPRDALGRPTAAIDPLGQTKARQYDSRSRLSRIDFPGGLGRVTFTFNATSNLIRKSYSDGLAVQYEYDATGRLVAADGLTLAYDGNNAIIGSNGIVIDRDPESNITRLTLAPGKDVTYTYDSRNLLTEIGDWLGGITTFSYDAAGRPSTITRPNGVTTTYTYDANNRLSSIIESSAGGLLSSIALTRDARGQVIAADRQVPLPASATAVASVAFSYDAASQVKEFTYDTLGRLISDGRRIYTWDLASRLKSYTDDAQIVSFTYDARGHRLSRSAGGMTRHYVWNYGLALPSISVERQDDGADLRYYVHTPGGFLLYSITAGDASRRFYHFDHVGSTLFLTDEQGAIQSSYAYTPYGIPLGAYGHDENMFTFLGGHGVMQEGTSDLYYMRVRYYDSVSGRFITRNPIEVIDPRAINPYQYGRGNPIGFIDPRGISFTAYEEGLGEYMFGEPRDESPGNFSTRDYVDAAIDRTAQALNITQSPASGPFAAFQESFSSKTFTTVQGRMVSGTSIGLINALPPAAVFAAASTVIDLAAEQVGLEQPHLFTIVENAGRLAGVVVEYGTTGDARVLDRYTQEQRSKGGAPAAFVDAGEAIGEFVDTHYISDPSIFGSTAYEEEKRRQASSAKLKRLGLIQYLQKEEEDKEAARNAREAPQKFLEAFRRRYSGDSQQ